ncbi:uncharacterized protein BCR38DRAFT_411867 [Pseudomassariella vexata]|uniref:C2H2-type domain-containing protein n=1 Tax=Pseudomassariella vexata TaxID=1141098 RepID=A0A1Y2DND4_9PEZI|nr:uncharacterized protein BCR38DRAFT_411867 [Pseudomassariella vexata]ORY60747.1 hypothetical protein BCR38DRAFT_411867 [Pseudomassariella vexata]
MYEGGKSNPSQSPIVPGSRCSEDDGVESRTPRGSPQPYLDPSPNRRGFWRRGSQPRSQQAGAISKLVKTSVWPVSREITEAVNPTSPMESPKPLSALSRVEMSEKLKALLMAQFSTTYHSVSLEQTRTRRRSFVRGLLGPSGSPTKPESISEPSRALPSLSRGRAKGESADPAERCILPITCTPEASYETSYETPQEPQHNRHGPPEPFFIPKFLKMGIKQITITVGTTLDAPHSQVQAYVIPDLPHSLISSTLVSDLRISTDHTSQDIHKQRSQAMIRCAKVHIFLDERPSCLKMEVQVWEDTAPQVVLSTICLGASKSREPLWLTPDHHQMNEGRERLQRQTTPKSPSSEAVGALQDLIFEAGTDRQHVKGSTPREVHAENGNRSRAPRDQSSDRSSHSAPSNHSRSHRQDADSRPDPPSPNTPDSPGSTSADEISDPDTEMDGDLVTQTDEACDLILRHLYGKTLNDVNQRAELWERMYLCVTEISRLMKRESCFAYNLLSGAVVNATHHSQGECSNTSHCQTASETPAKSGAGNPRKRSSGARSRESGEGHMNEDEDEDEDEGCPRKRCNTRKGGSGNQSQRYSCPFRKRNPWRFNVRDKRYRTCALDSFEGMTSLKRHIRNFHGNRVLNRGYRCYRCHKDFATGNELGTHLNLPANQMCEPRAPDNVNTDPEDGITAEIDNILAARNDKRVQDWDKLWATLFGNGDEVRSSVFEPPVEAIEAHVDFQNDFHVLRQGLTTVMGSDLSEFHSQAFEQARSFIDTSFDKSRKSTKMRRPSSPPAQIRLLAPTDNLNPILGWQRQHLPPGPVASIPSSYGTNESEGSFIHMSGSGHSSEVSSSAEAVNSGIVVPRMIISQPNSVECMDPMRLDSQIDNFMLAEGFHPNPLGTSGTDDEMPVYEDDSLQFSMVGTFGEDHSN